MSDFIVSEVFILYYFLLSLALVFFINLLYYKHLLQCLTLTYYYLLYIFIIYVLFILLIFLIHQFFKNTYFLFILLNLTVAFLSPCYMLYLIFKPYPEKKKHFYIYFQFILIHFALAFSSAPAVPSWVSRWIHEPLGNSNISRDNCSSRTSRWPCSIVNKRVIIVPPRDEAGQFLEKPTQINEL